MLSPLATEGAGVSSRGEPSGEACSTLMDGVPFAAGFRTILEWFRSRLSRYICLEKGVLCFA